MSNLFAEKSLLAKLMAEESIIVEMKATQEASFNLESRVLTVPTLKDNVSPEVFDVFISHEVSHALHTPRQTWLDVVKGRRDLGINMKIPHAILNVIEDARIEKLIKKKYPGLKPSYNKGYNDIIEMGLFGEKIKENKINEFKFLDKLNIFFKIGHIRKFDYKFNEVEEGFINAVSKAETFEDVITISKDITLYLKEKWSEKQKALYEDEEDEGGGVGGASDEFGKHYVVTVTNRKGDDSNEPFEYDPEGTYEFHYEYDEESGEDSDGESDGLEGFNTGNGNGRTSEFNVESEIDNAFSSRLSELYSDECIGYVDVVNNTNEFLVDYKDVYASLEKDDVFGNSFPKNNFINFKRGSNAIVAYLVKEFELRKNADQLKKTRIARSGDIHVDKLYSYKINENIFKKITIAPNGKSHGLVFFLDWSGSMSSYLSETIQQMIHLVFFCQKVNIPYEVYAFSSNFFRKCDNEPSWRTIGKISEKFKNTFMRSDKMVLDTSAQFHLMNILSSRMSKNEFVNSANFLLSIYDGTRVAYDRSKGFWDYPALPGYFCLGNTPLNNAIIDGIDVVNDFKKKYNLQVVNTIVLTDGESAESRVADFKTETLTKNGGYASWRQLNEISYARTYIRHEKYKEMVLFRKPRGEWRENMLYQTSIFLELFKKCTGSNIIGFYVIAPTYFNRISYNMFNNYEERELNKALFKKNNSITVKKYGFDEYHIIKSTSMKEYTSDLTFDNTTNARSIAKKFASHVKKKLENRVILQKFIQRISQKGCMVD